MKKIILSVIFCMIFTANIFASELNVINNSLSFYPQLGSDEQSYAFIQRDGSPGIINVADGYINVDIFDAAGRKLKENKKIKLTAEKVGGYAYDGNYHYILLGNDNPDSRGSVTVYNVLKYDLTFKRVGSLMIKGDQVYASKVFNSNENHLKLEGNVLFINDVVTEYKYSSDYYKNNRSFVIDKNSMQLTFGVGGMRLGFKDVYRYEVNRTKACVFDNNTYYFAISNGESVGLIRIEKNDMDARAEHAVVSLSKSGLEAYTPEGTLVRTISGQDVDLAGLEATKSTIIGVGTVDNGSTAKLYVSTVSADQYADMEGAVKYIDEGEDISNVTVKKISNDDILIMWENGGIANYCHLNASGKVITDGGMKKMYGADLPKSGYTYLTPDGRSCWTVLYDDKEFSVFKFK